MNTETTAIEVTEEAVQAEANRLINTAAAKHGLATSEIPQDLKDRAFAEARAFLESREKHKSDPYYQMYLESQEKLKTAESQLAATRESRIRKDEHVIVTTADAVQRRDPLAWHKMSIPQRLASVGVDPQTLDKLEVGRFFGKDSDHKAASDLMRSDQRKYKQMREAARILGIL